MKPKFKIGDKAVVFNAECEIIKVKIVYEYDVVFKNGNTAFSLDESKLISNEAETSDNEI